jgi:Arc/MetJ family transcription regulator
VDPQTFRPVVPGGRFETDLRALRDRWSALTRQHGMSKTLIDIEPELLARTQDILQTKTKKDTVNAALQEVVRRWAATEFGVLARTGIFDQVRIWSTPAPGSVIQSRR